MSYFGSTLMKKIYLISLLLLTFQGQAQKAYIIKAIETKNQSSFRSLSIPNDSIAWLGGTNGTIGRSSDGGNTWIFTQVKGYEKCDFRSLYAFDDKKAVIANAGSPAYILFTEDGGAHWKLVYENKDSAAFIDGIDYRSDWEGTVCGDPINGRMLMLGTLHAYASWFDLPRQNRPILEKGEASFAASGTTLRYMKDGSIMIATGGKVSRLLRSDAKTRKWNSINTPILQGSNSTGIFSFAFSDDKQGVIVGGDYKNETLGKDHVFYTVDGGKTWLKPAMPTGGYRECVEYIDEKTLISCGPNGADISYNKGNTWRAIPDAKGFHVVRKSRNGKLVILAGKDGKIAMLSR